MQVKYPFDAKYKNAFGVISKNIAISIVSKCGCSTIAVLHLKKKNIQSFYLENSQLSKDIWKLYWSNKSSQEELKNCKKIAIIRDPKERFISAYHTIGGELTWEEYCENSIILFSKNQIDRHIVLLCKHYDYHQIDQFVWLNDLGKWLESIGFENTIVNATPPNEKQERIVPQEILDYYKPDYDMISKIQDKIWKPV